MESEIRQEKEKDTYKNMCKQKIDFNMYEGKALRYVCMEIGMAR
jgi:hypothetical protein